MNIETANRLVQLRKENGYSQEMLADKLGISRQAVSKWERAEASPDTDNLIALARLYGMSLDELLGCSGEQKTAQEQKDGGESTQDNARQTNEQEQAGGAQSTGKKKADVHIGFDGIHVEDGKDSVHISREGIFVKDHEGNDVEISKDGVVLDGKHIMSKEEAKRRARKRAWQDFPFTVLVVAAYLALGFACSWWHPAWLLFLTIPLYHTAVTAVYKRSPRKFAYPVLAVLIFLALGFFVPGAWTWCWAVFLTVPVYYYIFRKSGRPHVEFEYSDEDDDDDEDDDEDDDDDDENRGVSN